jgi:hypothetical protein
VSNPVTDQLLAIETAFVAYALAVDGINSAFTFEPGVEGLGKLPCLTMMYRGASIRRESTGPMQELEHNWSVRLYVDASGGDGWEKAQLAMKTLCPALATAARDDMDLSNTCDKADLTDDLGEPQLLEIGSVFFKTMRLLARVDAL